MPLQQPQQPSAPYPSTSQPNMSLTMSNMPLSGAHPAPYGAMPVKPELANPAYYMNAFPPGGAPPPVQGGQMQLQQQPFQQLQQQQQPQLLSNPAYPTYLPPANVQYTGVASSVASAASASTAPGQASQQRQRASASASSGGQGSDEGDGSDGEGGEDGEDDGVWTKEVEDAFEEAFALYPPCGRRKIILNNEGKMFGRNELIARYIRMKTGKGRSRKQVSSHIQVIARKRQREIGERLKHCNQDMQRAAMENLATMSSAQLVSATLNPQAQVAAAAAQPYAEPITLPAATSAAALSAQMQRESLGTILQAVDAEAPASTSPQLSHQHPVTFSTSGAAPRDGPPAPRHQPNQVTLCQLASALEYPNLSIPPVFFVNIENEVLNDPQMEIVEAKLIADKFPQLRERFAQNPAGGFYLIKFWTELPGNMPQAFGFYPSSYWMTARFESQEQITLEVTRSVVSFGKTAQTKTVYLLSSGVLNGKHQYYMMQQPLCEYMQTFIEKLRGLPSRELMNNVLENFSASITVANAATKEVLLNLALIFEVISDDTGSQHNVYRLVDSQ
ncbi:transcriptional enhancer factor isoform 1A [Capsaspora owczarzaki ATCC 30864]|nr:transcriptional enhancer factor isoform 1A [Capsaspora owczarzaki ATCC 30864]|eukprot:XP_004347334.1 transcriptional enhancer factor isoform 1A [Capsaspora owczarzaki ATCC 30864]